MAKRKKPQEREAFTNRVVSYVDDEFAAWIRDERQRLGLTEASFIRMKLAEIRNAAGTK